MTQSLPALLDIKNLHVSYGAIRAVRGVSLCVLPGELVCLIGANGAGKSSLLKRIVGLLSSNQGEIIFNGENITYVPAYRLVDRGLALVPEGRGIFSEMSVMENLCMGIYNRQDRSAAKQDIDYVLTLFTRLGERLNQVAGTLSGGEQQMLAIARALLGRPRLLLLDEPSMGLAPILVRKIFEVIQTINNDGVSVLLIEQNAVAALNLASRAYVMEHGEIPLSGDAQKLLHDPQVMAAYLGG